MEIRTVTAAFFSPTDTTKKTVEAIARGILPEINSLDLTLPAALVPTALFSVLSIFYASQLTVLSAFLAIIFKVLAMAAALLLLLRKVGKGNFSFAFSAFAPLFAVTIILL